MPLDPDHRPQKSEGIPVRETSMGTSLWPASDSLLILISKQDLALDPSNGVNVCDKF